MKRSKLNLEKYLALIGGLIMIALAVVTLFAAKGHTKVLEIIMEAIGVIAIIGGFFIASFAGAICALIAVIIVVKLLEAFTIPAAILLMAGGAVLIVCWLKDYGVIDFSPKKKEESPIRKSYPKTSASSADLGSVPGISYGQYNGQDIHEVFTLHSVDNRLVEDGKIGVGSFVTVRLDKEKDTFDFMCGGEAVSSIDNCTYEHLKRRAYYIQLQKAGKRMVVISIEPNIYGHVCDLNVGVLDER